MGQGNSRNLPSGGITMERAHSSSRGHPRDRARSKEGHAQGTMRASRGVLETWIWCSILFIWLTLAALSDSRAVCSRLRLKLSPGLGLRLRLRGSGSGLRA